MRGGEEGVEHSITGLGLEDLDILVGSLILPSLPLPCVAKHVPAISC